MHRLQRFALCIDRANEWLGRALAWLVLAMAGVIFGVVALRKLLDWGSIALQESGLYLHALAFMAGVAYTLKHDEHVRVDIFYRDLSPRGQAWVNLLGALFFLLPLCGFVLWISADYVLDAWSRLEGSREAGGLPLVFLLKSFIPLLAVLLGLQGLSQAIHNLMMLRGVEAPAPHPDEGDRL